MNPIFVTTKISRFLGSIRFFFCSLNWAVLDSEHSGFIMMYVFFFSVNKFSTSNPPPIFKCSTLNTYTS